MRQSEFTIFRIKSLLDKSLTRKKRKIRVTKKDNSVNKPRQRDETEGFKRSYIMYANLVFKNPGMCIE